ncbi:hypothetical protein [Chryseobacterium sp. SIMBA_038]|uniref:hypothetical protein n=1 Tax=Chryseobacterium sp. SIMBA_038 TaxID=3085780 RepID=UPI00397B59A0
MPITNLNNTHLTTAQVDTAKTSLTTLEAALESINVNLSAEDRQKYGSINEQNKLFVNKVYDFNKNQPELSAIEVDWAEFGNDYTSRQNYEGLIARLDSLVTRLKNAKTLHDYDNYQAALTDYAFTAYKAGTASPGYEVKQNELKQFFSKTTKSDGIPPADKA